MGRLYCFLLALAGAALGEVFDEPCYELGKQWVYEAKDMLLCDRSGRRININKFCKSHLSSTSGRLIIDSSKEDGPTDPKKQANHFPELCLPGQRSYAVQAPWLCTCVMHKGRHRYECVVPEGRTAGGLDGSVPGRSKRSAEHEHEHAVTASTLAEADAPSNVSSVLPSTPGLTGRLGTTRMMMTAGTSTPASASAETHEEHSGAPPPAAVGGGHNGTVLGRQAAPYKPNIIIDFCDEFGYVHSVTSSIRECACDKDVIATRLFSFKDNDPYHSSGLFSPYECLPGTYSVRCEICYPNTQTCQPSPCP